jgi:integrase
MPIAEHRLTTARALSIRVPSQPGKKGKKARYSLTWDTDLKGLAVRVTVRGVRSWVFEMRVADKTVRRTLGPVQGSEGRGGLNDKTARAKARLIIGELSLGKDRLVERRESAKVDKRTFGDALADYTKTKRSAGRPLKATTVAGLLAHIDPPSDTRSGGALYELADRSLAKLTGSELRKLHDKLKRRAEKRAAKHGIDSSEHNVGRQADIAMLAVRAVLRHEGVRLVDDPFSKETPGARRITIAPSRGNPQPIPADKLGDFWIAALQRESDTADVLRCALLTGLRPGELAALTVKDFDPQAKTLHLKDTKNRKPHTVHLSKEAWMLVEAAARGKKRPTQPLWGKMDCRKTLAAIAGDAGIKQHLTPHKMRQSFATIADSLDIARTVRDAMLNHAGDGVGATHYVGTRERLRPAWEMVATHVYKLAEEACKRRGLDPVVTLYGRDLRHLA